MVLKILERNQTLSFDNDRAEQPGSYDAATRSEAHRIFRDALSRGGSALAKATAADPYKRVSEFDPSVEEIALLPRVAGG